AAYKASLPENSPFGTVVVTVSATDADKGANGEVTYEFSRISDKAKKAFAIDHKTGDIKVIGPIDFEDGSIVTTSELDREIVSDYNITITASDDGSPSLSSFKTVQLFVSDVNDNPPVFDIQAFSAYDNGQPSLSTTCSLYLLISDNLAEIPELKDMSYEENNSKLTSYLIIALVSVSTFFLTFIILVVAVRICQQKKPRVLFDGTVTIPSAYLPPGYTEVDGTGTLRSSYNYDTYLTAGSRTSDFKFVQSYNDNTLPADQTISPRLIASYFTCIMHFWQLIRGTDMGYKGFPAATKLLHCYFLTLVFQHTTTGDVNYSILEETRRGTVIGNIVKDLGLHVKLFSARKARLDTEGTGRQLCDINLNTGDLIVAERIDREELCGEKTSCPLKYDLVLENPLELHRVNVQIQDVNDNTPIFPTDVIKLEITESADRGARFPVIEAHDADIGENSVQTYTLQRNDNFVLSVMNTDGGKYGELVLEKELDREQQQESVFKAKLQENSPFGTVVVTVSAADADEGANGEVTYGFSRIADKAKKTFKLHNKTGLITVTGPIDYEEASYYEMRIEAKDGAGLVSQCK
ncbi:hypothetical protein Z043_125980, partial [Scleropages formosus]